MRLLSAKFLFDGEKLYSNRSVILYKDTVVDIGTPKLLSKTYQIKPEDLGEGVLFPGFVNLHTHLELSYMQNSLPKHAGFIDWLQAIMVKKSAEADKNIIDKAMEREIKTMYESGVRIVGDISNTLASCQYIKQYMPKSVVFFENYSLKKEKACEIVENLKAGLAEYTRQCHNLKISPTAHSLYSTHSCLLNYLSNFDKSLPFSLHFLESEYEKEFLLSTGKMFDFLNSLGLIDENLNFSNVFDYLEYAKALRKNTIFVHCVHADKDDLENIKKVKGTVCLCVRSNDFISKAAPDVYMINKSGVNIGVGTDSLASNDSLNFLDELKFIYKKFNELGPDEIFRWATSNGGKALNINFGFKKGFLSYGVFIRTSGNHPLEEILSGEGGKPLSADSD